MQKMLSPYKILVVEDDAAIRRGMVDALTVSGYGVIEGKDGYEGQKLAQSEEYDLALLDVVMPGVDGFTILRQIRADRPTIPAIMLTAKGEESDRVRGLKLGADDYVVKPFSVRELLARIEAVLRRSPERPQALGVVEMLDGKLDLERHLVVFKDGREEKLTNKEYELVKHLATHPGRVVSKDEIMTRVWKMDPRLVETRSLDTTLARLREKLGESNAEMIVTLRGRGYAWKTDLPS